MSDTCNHHAGQVTISAEAKCWIQKVMLQQTNLEDIDAPSEILDGFLYLGNFENANCREQLDDLNISHVLNVTTNPDLGKHNGISTLHLYIQDHETENIRALFSPAYDFICAARDSQGRVLVHCMAGRSRSASLVIAYLMRHHKFPLDEAFFHTKKRRAEICPNWGFWQQLMDEEKSLFDRSSPMPQSYQRMKELHGERKVTPGLLFQHYVTAYLNQGHDVEACSRVVSGWPEGMGGGGCVEEILLQSLEHLSSDGRRAAVDFINQLRTARRFTQGEVFEGFGQLLQNIDLEDLKIDIPLISEYLRELLELAQQMGLIPSGSLELPGPEESRDLPGTEVI
eukprot:gnl/MRDRNA2_/MRDRNA2_121333_c0_seq1.p1 gnl/MRDRNA2_/MRDRNA2_121333_c0~~gnl/MRDRNA2_/MRDRNA2_121333_c0_seq1.p1  ORF type:complete len:340 (+),score=61.47 gnl/MRDRNA2_/MRDRNA2_121333_c0_seq1:75-1094(+)